jgi:hypothetical protein
VQRAPRVRTTDIRDPPVKQGDSALPEREQEVERDAERVTDAQAIGLCAVEKNADGAPRRRASDSSRRRADGSAPSANG